MGLIEKILSYFGYIRKDKAEETIRYLKSQLALRESELTTMKEDYDDVCDRLTDANTRLVSLNADTGRASPSIKFTGSMISFTILTVAGRPFNSFGAASGSGFAQEAGTSTL